MIMMSKVIYCDADEADEDDNDEMVLQVIIDLW